MIVLLKAVCIKSQASIVKTLKICKDMKAKYGHYRESFQDVLIPEGYKAILKAGVEQNKSLYDLHANFSETYKEIPICRLCLLEVSGRGCRRSENEDYSHFACQNLLTELDKNSCN